MRPMGQWGTSDEVSLKSYAASKIIMMQRHFHYEWICKTTTNKTYRSAQREKFQKGLIVAQNHELAFNER